jgi:hypothetical protein
MGRISRDDLGPKYDLDEVSSLILLDSHLLVYTGKMIRAYCYIWFSSVRTGFFTVGLVALSCLVLAGMGPIQPGNRVDPKSSHELVADLDPSDFRFILVGDSQTTDASADRIRTQFHGWDAPIVGELFTVGNVSAGYWVNNSNAGIPNLSYTWRDPVAGWGDFGPHDFLATAGAQWTCTGDITSPGSRIGRYLLNFSASNTSAPWREQWGVGIDLVAKIAVRTTPNTVGLIETRPERGGVVSFADRRVHTLPAQWGVKVIEQVIPASINPTGEAVGVGLYLPQGQIEEGGDKLEILGVVITRVGRNGRAPRGMIVSYMGRWGWNIYDHINRLTIPSRAALIKMIDPRYIMIMLGHNIENGGADTLRDRTEELTQLWDASFDAANRPRPTYIYVVPWVVSGWFAEQYIVDVEEAFVRASLNRRNSILINMYARYDRVRPDQFDPDRYQLDSSGVHPGNIPTAKNIADDLYQMLFNPETVGE